LQTRSLIAQWLIALLFAFSAGARAAAPVVLFDGNAGEDWIPLPHPRAGEVVRLPVRALRAFGQLPTQYDAVALALQLRSYEPSGQVAK